MTDKGAIEEIINLYNVQLLEKTLDKGQALIPNTYKLEDLERFQSTPNRFRGQYTTNAVHEFTDYLNQHADSDTGVFIDPSKPAARAIIDLGTPEAPRWGSHKAELVLEKTAAYKALLTNTQRKSQQDFIDFIEDWFDSIVFYDTDGQGQDLKTVIGAIRKLSIKTEGDKTSQISDYGHQSSEFDKIEVQANGTLPPAYFIFAVEPYLGFDVREIKCQMRLHSDDKKVALSYRIIGLEKLTQAIGDELLEILKDGITVENIRAYIGTMAY